MNDPGNHQTHRRNFLAQSSALAAASLPGFHRTAAAEPPPEVTRIRLVQIPALRFAPQYVAEALLRLEGFEEIAYVKLNYTLPATLSKSADLAMFGGPRLLPAIESDFPISLSYCRRRTDNPADTLRFYALRLRGAGVEGLSLHGAINPSGQNDAANHLLWGNYKVNLM